MSFNSCGTCPTCITGRPTYCHDFFARNFAASRPDGTTALSRGGEPIHSDLFGQSSFATYAGRRPNGSASAPSSGGQPRG